MTLTNDWIRQISSSLIEKDAVPLTGAFPVFPWEQFSKQLSETFNLDSLKIEPSDAKWREPDEVLMQVPDPMPLHFSVPAVGGAIGWLMPKGDVLFLMQRLLSGSAGPSTFSDQSLADSFLKFLALEAIGAIGHAGFDSIASPQLLKEGQFPKEAALCYDITATLPERQIFGRLVLSSEFRDAWTARHQEKARSELFNSDRAKKLEVELHLEIGKCSIPYSEWRTVKTGDFLLIDDCTWKPEKKSAQVRLTCLNIPLFYGKLKEGSIKILEHPQYREVETPMEPPEEEFEELGEDFGEELELGDETIEEAEAGEEAEEQKPAKAEADARPLFSPEKVPLTLSVEVGRIEMTLQKLAELEPGNMIELSATPESGVDIVFQGKCVGRGELLKVGDVLGVRITELPK